MTQTYTIKINDWGSETTHIANTSDEIVDIVMASGIGAYVSIEDHMCWDRAREEAPDFFWDFVEEVKKNETKKI